MNARTRFLIVFTLGFCACLGASWIAVAPLRDADDSWQTVRDKLVEQQNRAAVLDPSDAKGLEQLLSGLEETEQLGEARRDEIANSAVIQILISFLCTGLAYWVAVSVSGRLTGAHRRTPKPRRHGLRAPLHGGATVPPRSRPRVRETGSPEERVFIADYRGVLEYVNPTIARDLGRPREALVGTSLAALFGGGAEGALGAVLDGFGPNKSTAHLEVAVGDPTDPTWIALDLHARFDARGAIAEIVGYGQDVSDERRAREGAESVGTDANSAGGRDGSPTLAGARVLVAASGRDHRRLIDFYLNQGGAKVTLAESGSDALEMASTKEFDLVVLEDRKSVV